MVLSTQSVAELAEACIKLFDQTLNVAGLVNNQWAENRRADFSLWVDGVGARARQHASLDSRLESREDELALIKTILLNLKSYLKRCLTAAEEEPLREAKQDVDAAIDNLALIAVAIRQAGKRSRLSKADRSFDRSTLVELEIHLTCMAMLRRTSTKEEIPTHHEDGPTHHEDGPTHHEDGPTHHEDGPTHHEDGAPSVSSHKLTGHLEQHKANPDWWWSEIEGEPTPLQDRLIEANLRRRNRFLYAQRHSRKLAIQQAPAKEPVAIPPAPDREEVSSAKDTGVTHRQVFGNKERKTENPPVLASKSSTFASNIDSSLNLKIVFQVPKTQITSITGATEYPKLRKPLVGKSGELDIEQTKIQKCPCCCEALPRAAVASKNAWKKHLSGDVLPYTCISEDCPSPLVLYSTRAEWEDHMQKEHPKKWRCRLCDSGESSLFSEVAELVKHVRQKHMDSFLEDDLEAVQLWPSTFTIGLDRCPLCRSAGPLDDPTLVDHVLEHTHEFALLSLPWADMPTEGLAISDFFDLGCLKPVEPSTTAEPAIQTVQSWMLTWLDGLDMPKPEEWDESVALLEKLKDSRMANSDNRRDDHFARNPYFATDSEASTQNSQRDGSSSSKTRVLKEVLEARKIRDHGETLQDNVELADLCRKLSAAREKTPNGSFFIPQDQIKKFAEKSIIKSVIEEFGVNDREMLAEVVSKHCRRIFLILILMNRLGWLERLVALSLTDDSLPLKLDQDHEKLIGISTSGERFDFPSDAPVQDERMFRTFQSLLTAPVFEGNRKFGQLLQESQPLPYLEFSIAGEKPAGKGFFSEVDETRIHCDHLPEYQPSPGTNYVIVAIKRFTQSDEAWAEKDVANANTLQSPIYKSRHLTQAIAAYTIQGGGKFIMLPWADGGHLDNYWEGLPRGHLGKEDVMWVLAEFAGLCEALKLLHAQNFRHNDLKPENILWFKEENVPDNLKISDFGLSTCHGTDKNTNVRANLHTLTPSGTNRYKPPEENEHRQPAARSRYYDIWSMGCTMTELMVWLVYGYDALREFQAGTSPYFWKELQESRDSTITFKLTDTITFIIGSMMEHAHDCTAYVDILKLIRDNLLCVLYPAEYGYATERPGYRIKASALHGEMKQICAKCKSEPNYLNCAGIGRTGKLPKRLTAASTEGGSLAVPKDGVGKRMRDPLLLGRLPHDELANKEVVIETPIIPSITYQGMNISDDNGRATAHTASLTRSESNPGLLGTRYRIDKDIVIDTPTPWRDEIASEEESSFQLFLNDPNDLVEPIHEEGSAPWQSFGSDYADSETVKSVKDLGLSDRKKFDSETRDSIYEDLNPDQLCRQLNIQQDTNCTFNLQQAVCRKIGNSLKHYGTTEKFRYLPLDAFDKIITPQIIYSLLKESFPRLSNKQLRCKVNEVLGGENKESSLSPRRNHRRAYRKRGDSTDTKEPRKSKESSLSPRRNHRRAYRKRGDSTDTKEPRKSRRRILALLVFMKALNRFEHFIKNRIYDSDFPLEDDGNDIMDSNGPHKFLEGWDVYEMNTLLTFQYFFWVPFFLIKGGELRFYLFNSKTVLPWESIKSDAHSGSGTIRKVQIHSAHFSFEESQPSDGPIYFALKEVDNVNREEYRQEFKALEKTCARTYKDKHLIKLLLAFHHGENQYFLFEWADGNLEQLWDQTSGDSFQTTWAIEQCVGIATAIRRIHVLSSKQEEARKSSQGTDAGGKEWGRHGDIKPQNILWFKKYGEDNDLLVLSEHSIFTKFNMPHYQIDGYSGAYRPPEMDTGNHISPKYDIWSLGCVYLEFFIWYLEGSESLLRFSTQRQMEDDSSVLNIHEDKYFMKMFDDNRRPYAVVKPSISEWIKKLQHLDSCPEVIKEILQIIESHMLVVDSSDRKSIGQICVSLTRILKSAQQNTSQLNLDSKNALAQNVGGVQTDDFVIRPATLDIADEEESSASADNDTKKHTTTLKRDESASSYASVAARGPQKSAMEIASKSGNK